MIENIKVDVVYFMTATDFEFEFNLGSCCHMRLLNGKANDKKSFVSALARAVSRSQIIICCGPLFGEDGLISVSATAISHGLETVNNSEYGISSDDKIEIIEGSLPLVTPEGYFGGCIIESGSQTIVLLTENRTLRKSIMKNLVHPYIEDVSLMQSAEKIVSEVKKTETDEIAEPEQTGEATEETSEATEQTGEATGEIGEPVQPEAEAAAEETEITPAEETAQEASDEAGEAVLSEETEPAKTEAAENAVKEETGKDTQENKTAENTDETETEAVKENDHNIEFDFSIDETETSDTENTAESLESGASDFNDIFIREDTPQNPDEKKPKISNSMLTVILFLLFAVLALMVVLIVVPLANGMTTGEYVKSIFGTAFVSKYI